MSGRRSFASLDTQRVPYGLGVWTMPVAIESVVALLFTIQEYSVGVSYGIDVSWWRVLTKEAVFCSVWALAAPGVAAVVLNASCAAWKPSRLVVALVAIAVGTAIAQSSLMELFARVANWPTLQLRQGTVSAFEYEVARRIVNYLSASLLQISLFALLYHALEHDRQRRRRDLAESELRARLAEAELGSLRTQLQPHFLFNTLNTISALMRSDAEAGQRVLTRLGDLLRIALDRLREQQVSLGEELDFLRLYLDIQRARFGSRLTWTLDVPANVRTALVPSLLLQPLVENAFRHGLEPKQGPGHVWVRAARDAECLTIEVIDDGLGLRAAPRRDGIGLGNTRERLLRLYETNWSLELVPGAPRGAIVRVRLPFEEDERLTAERDGA